MDDKTLIKNLNWFYSLEVTQVDNYLAQSKAVKDPYIATGLEKVALIEQGHVDKISSMIISLGAKPTLLGDVLSPFLGTALGKLMGITDLPTMLYYNIKIEAKATTDYQQLIEKLRSQQYAPSVVRTLEYNLIEEDLHSCWFAQVIEQHQNQPWPLSAFLAKEKKEPLRV